MTADAPDTRRGGRRVSPWAAAGAVFVVTLSAVTLAGYLARRSLAESLLLELLASQGIERAAVTVHDLDAAHLELREFHIASGKRADFGGFELETDVESISIHYTLGRLLDGQLDLAVLTGMRVRATQVASASAPAEAQAAPASPAAEPARSELSAAGEVSGALWPLALPARELRIDDLRIEIETPSARITATGSVLVKPATESAGWQVDVDLNIAPAGLRLSGVDLQLHRAVPLSVTARAGVDALQASLASFVFDATLGTSGSAVRIGGKSPTLLATLRSARETEHRIEIASRGGDLRVPDFDIAIAGIAIKTTFAPGALPDSLAIEIGRLTDTATPPRVAPLRLEANVASAGDLVSFDARVADVDRRAAVDLLGRIEPASARGEIRLHLPAVDFAPDGLQPRDLLPRLGNALSHVAGHIEVLGNVRFTAFSADAIRSSLQIAVSDMNLTTPLSTIKQLDTVVQLEGPWPLSSPPGQVVSIGSLDVGVAVTDGLAAFELRKDGVLDIERAELLFADGKLQTAGEVDLSSDVQQLVLSVKGVSLAALIERLDFDGLSGTGTLNGRIPLLRSADALEIRDGRLEAVGRGTIAYRPKAGAESLAAGQKEVEIALNAMSNFQYDALSLDLSGATSGQVELLLHVAGRNPDFHGGFPVEFNLALESSLKDVLRQVEVSNSFVEAVEANASAFRARASNFRRRAASELGPKAPQ